MPFRSDKQRKAMFARMQHTSPSLPKPDVFKRTLDKPNHKIYKTSDARITFVDDGVGRYPISVIAERKDGISYVPIAIEQFRTRAEARTKIRKLKKEYRSLQWGE